ncbi:MAG: hypothetical protein ACFE9R_14480 [Candidatus Hermodarchaeota archaeon]
MASEYAILAKLGGYVGSNPEIISSYPSLISKGDKQEILQFCFPFGVKPGNFVEDRYKKYLVLSYIFRVTQETNRDDLFSFSILLHKRDKIDIYKAVINRLIEILENDNLLNEKILTDYHQTIYEGINKESDVYIEDVLVDFSKIFEEIKAQILKQKPELKGSFF